MRVPMPATRDYIHFPSLRWCHFPNKKVATIRIRIKYYMSMIPSSYYWTHPMVSRTTFLLFLLHNVLFLALQREEDNLASRYDDSIYPIPLYLSPLGPMPALIKKSIMCNKGTIYFCNSDDAM